MRTIVFCGPSISWSEVQEISSEVFCMPPARCGDLLRAMRLAPRCLVLVDGCFDSTPSPWHKEILLALEAGIAVYGAASLGALRAAELDCFGMVGVGRIYKEYRLGVRSADDDVAVMHHGPERQYQPISQPLVDIEYWLSDWQQRHLLNAETVAQLMLVAQGRHYSERHISEILQSLPLESSLQQQLVAEVRTGVLPSLKRQDAAAAIESAAAHWVGPGKLTQPVHKTVFIAQLLGSTSLEPFSADVEALPHLERLLCQCPTLLQSAAVLGGLMRALSLFVEDDLPEPMLGALHPVFVHAAALMRQEFADHPLARKAAVELELVHLPRGTRETEFDHVLDIWLYCLNLHVSTNVIELLRSLASSLLERLRQVGVLACVGRTAVKTTLNEALKLEGIFSSQALQAFDVYDVSLLKGACLYLAVEGVQSWRSES